MAISRSSPGRRARRWSTRTAWRLCCCRRPSRARGDQQRAEHEPNSLRRSARGSRGRDAAPPCSKRTAQKNVDFPEAGEHKEFSFHPARPCGASGAFLRGSGTPVLVGTRRCPVKTLVAPLLVLSAGFLAAPARASTIVDQVDIIDGKVDVDESGSITYRD